MFCRWADRQSAEGRDGNVHSFDHPFLQVKESRFDACSFFMITTFSLEKICFIAHIKLPVHIFVPKIRALKLKWSFYEGFFCLFKKKIPVCNLFFNCLFIQAVGMFLGEFSCLIVFQIIKTYNRVRRPNQEPNLGNQSFNPLIFLPPALCDMCGTSLMYVGLNLTFASSFQMLRGNGRDIYGIRLK